MRIKEGKVVLGKNDYRVGNFVLTLESGGKYVRMQDINGVMSLRVDASTSRGTYLRYLIEEKADDMLSNIVAVTFNVNLAVPDMDFLNRVNTETVECVKRHPELYGVSESGQSEEEIIEEQKAVNAVIEQARRDGLDN